MIVGKYWLLLTIGLVVITVVGGVVVWSKFNLSPVVEISLPLAQHQQGSIYIDGAVVNSGFYPLNGEDSVEVLIQAAGGTTDGADLSQLRLYLPRLGEGEGGQKIDINRAEVWLLEALPGIGETLAERIVYYRQQNGPFRNTGDLLKVTGIGDTTYEQIKPLITVAER